MKPNKKALKAISKMPLDIGPFKQTTTGAIVPFFNDARAVPSHPKIFNVFAKELAKIVKKYQKEGKRIDIIIGVPMAGIPIGMAVAMKCGLPFAYMNKERKKTLRKKIVEGDYKKGARAVLIDDVIGLGGTLLKAVADCKKDGVAVKHIITMWNPWHLRSQPFMKKIKKMGITYNALYTRHSWINYLLKKKLISKEMKEIQEIYLADLVGWHKDKQNWQKFLKWKRRYKKTGKL